MRIKVHDGTVLNGESNMCSTCRHATIIRGRRLDEEIIICRGLTIRGVRVPFKVTSCSAYSDQRLPTYMELFEDAWILQRGTRKRPAGFVRGRELRDEELFEPAAAGGLRSD